MANVLVLSGGGYRGIYTLGALDYLLRTKHLDTITTYVGVSIGAIISCLLSLGICPIDMLSIALKQNMLSDIHTKFPDILGVIDSFGLFTPTNLLNIVNDIITAQTGKKDLTLLDHYEITKKRLCIVTYNTTKHKTEYIDYISNPDLLCIHAITMSISVPIIFTPFKYNDCTYVDGGIGNAFPIDQFDFPPNKLIGIVCRDTTDDMHTSSKHRLAQFTRYIIGLVEAQTKELMHLNISYCSKDRCMVIDIPTTVPIITIQPLDTTSMNEMYTLGYNTAKEYIQKKNNVC